MGKWCQFENVLQGYLVRTESLENVFSLSFLKRFRGLKASKKSELRAINPVLKMNAEIQANGQLVHRIRASLSKNWFDAFES